jgi:hypothetical protein
MAETNARATILRKEEFIQKSAKQENARVHSPNINNKIRALEQIFDLRASLPNISKANNLFHGRNLEART